MLSEDKLSGLLDLLYAGVGENDGWQRFLEELAKAAQASMVVLISHDQGQICYDINTVVGMSPDAQAGYANYYGNLDVWYRGSEGKLRPNYTFDGRELCPTHELVKTEFYNDFLKPNGWLHECSAVTGVEKSTFSRIFTLRSPRSGAFTSEEIELCSNLAPHLQSAARIRQRIADLEATVDRLLAGEMDTHALAKLSLTPAETRLAIALFKGQSVEAYAKEAAISINTARWYVKQIYAKTGVNRQTELINMLLKFHRRS